MSWQGSALILSHDTTCSQLAQETTLRIKTFRRPSTSLAILTPRGAAGLAAMALAAQLSAAVLPGTASAQSALQDGLPIKSRNLDVSREGAAKMPRGESDQAIVDGWPLYRTPRGQTAFNDAMATLRATDGTAPSAAAFKGCAALDCHFTLPAVDEQGWLPAGRIWVSPKEYVLIAHSPRNRNGSYRRRPLNSMKYFVFHEFHNSTRNNDAYDTISSHAGSVFVPLYMSKQGTDAKGRQFVIVVQVAPYDVVSVHATNRGSAGPGMEVAKSAAEELQPLQGLAGILIAELVKSAAPRLQVVNHHGNEGLPMLSGYERRLELLKARSSAASIALPFVPAAPQRVAAATGRLDDVILRRGASPPLAIAERGVVPSRKAVYASMPGVALPEPVLVGPIRLATRPSQAAASAPTSAEPALATPVKPVLRRSRAD